MQENRQNTALYETETAFEEQFRNLYTPLCRYALVYTKDKDEAEDIVQSVFVRTWQNRRSIRLTGSSKSYLYKAVFHECVNRGRHLKVKGEYMEDNLREMESTANYAHHTAESRELEKHIATALNELPPQCGKAFRLSRFHKLTYTEIADVMGISVKTVENQMGKALGLMRLKLAEFLVFVFVWMLNQ